MEDVARAAGVAVSTVSYAINGTRPISAATRARIEEAMDALGYRPHAVARALASRRSRIIAVALPTERRGLGRTDLDFVSGAVEAAKELGYHVVVWPAEFHDRADVETMTSNGLVDGVLLMEVCLEDDRVEALTAAGRPLAMIGRTADPTGLAHADIDFEQTMDDAVEHLHHLGHRHIAFVNHDRSEFDAGYGPAVRTAAAFDRAMVGRALDPVSRFCCGDPAEGCGSGTTGSRAWTLSTSPTPAPGAGSPVSWSACSTWGSTASRPTSASGSLPMWSTTTGPTRSWPTTPTPTSTTRPCSSCWSGGGVGATPWCSPARRWRGASSSRALGRRLRVDVRGDGPEPAGRSLARPVRLRVLEPRHRRVRGDPRSRAVQALGRVRPAQLPQPVARQQNRQYLLGDRLLIAPVLRAGGSVQYYVPAGRWTHLLSGETVDGPGWRTETHDVLSLPLLVGPGTLLATSTATQGRPDRDLAESLLLTVYELGEGERAGARVPDRSGGVGVTFTAERVGDLVTVTRHGGSGPWRAALGGAPCATVDVAASDDRATMEVPSP